MNASEYHHIGQRLRCYNPTCEVPPAKDHGNGYHWTCPKCRVEWVAIVPKSIDEYPFGPTWYLTVPDENR